MPVLSELSVNMLRSVDSGAEYLGRSSMNALSYPVQLYPQLFVAERMSRPICLGEVKSRNVPLTVPMAPVGTSILSISM